ncbi:MAG: NAD(P)-dependent oxidoreductase [Flammeovirgaceae bacterium]|nr:NAD(P)-dependent oxidoreductase [Flammeovirgaceae bacterium]
MKILVTGANGLLGQKLCERIILDNSMTLIATARNKLTYPLNHHTFQILDICSKDQVDNVVSSTKPDVIINTAAMTNVDQCENEKEACWEANVLAVANLVEASKKIDCHFIHLSTDFIFNGKEGPLDELASPGPVNYYGRSKLAAEELIRNSLKNWSIVRTVLVFGITDDMSRSNIVLWVKKSLEEKRSIRVVNDQWRTPTLAEDLAEGCYLVAKKKAFGVYHISGRDFLSPYDIAIQTADFFNLDKSLISATNSNTFKQDAERPLKTGFIIDKAKKDLGYRPHSFKEGLAMIASQLS